MTNERGPYSRPRTVRNDKEFEWLANQSTSRARRCRVAARLGTFESKVLNIAGERRIIRDWDGATYVSWDTASKVAEKVRADDEQARELTRQRNEEHERKIEAEAEALRHERATNTGRRAIHGVEVSTPATAPARDDGE